MTPHCVKYTRKKIAGTQLVAKVKPVIALRAMVARFITRDSREFANLYLVT